jgi:hypothetical protein
MHMLARRTGRRRINEALAVVSPLAFADAVEAYVTSLNNDEVRALVNRSAKRMDSSERLQFALFLDHDAATTGVAELFSGPIMRAEEVHRLVERCDDFLPNRFAAFLRENPRAVPALGDDAVNNILSMLPLTTGPKALTGEVRARRMPARLVLAVVAVALIALAPLLAQYVHQSGMIAGTANPLMVPLAPVLHTIGHTPKTVRAAVMHRGVAHRAPPRHVAHRIPPQRILALKPMPAYTGAATRRRGHHVVHVAKVWKFDPRFNPYVRHARIASVPAHIAAAPKASTNPFEARARLVVNSYLGAVIAGDTARALAHLGLPVGSDPKAISESAIITRDAKAQIVAVKPGDDGTTHVQVDIMGRRGEYFEVFSVTPDGPAVRIKDRFYIPVNRTAEEISARLLATRPH